MQPIVVPEVSECVYSQEERYEKAKHGLGSVVLVRRGGSLNVSCSPQEETNEEQAQLYGLETSGLLVLAQVPNYGFTGRLDKANQFGAGRDSSLVGCRGLGGCG